MNNSSKNKLNSFWWINTYSSHIFYADRQNSCIDWPKHWVQFSYYYSKRYLLRKLKIHIQERGERQQNRSKQASAVKSLRNLCRPSRKPFTGKFIQDRNDIVGDKYLVGLVNQSEAGNSSKNNQYKIVSLSLKCLGRHCDSLSRSVMHMTGEPMSWLGGRVV